MKEQYAYLGKSMEFAIPNYLGSGLTGNMLPRDGPDETGG
jgi:hypothetical protein